MTSTDKEDVEGSFNLKTSRNNTMHTFFYSNIYEFARNLEGMIDEGIYKTTIHNMHKLGWKSKPFNSNDAMLGHGCGVSKYSQFCDRTQDIQNINTSKCGNLFR